MKDVKDVKDAKRPTAINAPGSTIDLGAPTTGTDRDRATWGNLDRLLLVFLGWVASTGAGRLDPPPPRVGLGVCVKIPHTPRDAEGRVAL